MIESGPSVLTSAPRDGLGSEARDALGQAYAVGDWLAWQRTPKGRCNVSFFVTTSLGKYVLRCSNPCKSNASMRFEVRLIDYLRRRDYPAPEIIPTRAGQLYVEYGGRFYLLTALIPGTPYDPANPQHVGSAGRGLGRYHRLVREFPGPYYRWPAPALTNLGPQGLGTLAEVERSARRLPGAEERQRFRETLAYLREQFLGGHQELVKVYPGLTQLVNQSSFGRSALLFDGAALVGVVDYDRATWEVRVLDLAYTLKAFCRSKEENQEGHRVSFDCGRCRDLLAGYHEEEPLAREERQALPLLLRVQRLLKILRKCGNFLTRNAVVPQEVQGARKVAAMAEREAARLRWLGEHSADLLAAFSA